MSADKPEPPRRDPRAERARLTARDRVEPTSTELSAVPADAAPLRRDPRADRLARTARAPAAVVADPSPVAPPAEAEAPRLRRDPRAERRLPRSPEAVPAVPAKPAGPQVLKLEPTGGHVVVIAGLEAGTLSRGDREALGAGRALADGLDAAMVLVAVTGGNGAARFDAGAAGADRLMLLADPALSGPVANRAGAVVAAIEALAARHVILAADSAELARRVAARMGERPAFNAIRLAPDMVTVLVDAGRSEASRPTPRIIVLAPERFDAVASTPLREARPLPVPVTVAETEIVDRGLLPVDPAAIPLQEAELIVAAGNGITDWQSFHALARALGAAEAGSRVACDNGDLPRDRQVGASGLVVSPRCYVALGISGASQHLDGIVGVEHVVAVNRDPHAEMLKRAELAVVADAQAVMPALLARIGRAG
jgi:electron transfer flavoprotein alpha subunit